MKIKSLLKLLAGLLIILNVEGLTKNYRQVDSTVQFQDSTIQKIWEVKKDTTASAEILVSNNKIFYTLDDGLVFCYDFNGNEKWIAEVFGSIKNNSVQYKDLFLTATQGGDLYSINSNNGDVVQVIGVGENITTDLVLVDVANSGYESKGVIFGTGAGNIFCYDIFSFEIVWKINLSKNSIISKPLFINDKIIFKDDLSSLYCINAKSGILIWKYDFDVKENKNNNSLLLGSGNKIYALSPNDEVLAIDLMLGKKLWSTKNLNVFPQITISEDRQNFILLGKKGELLFLSSKDGKEINKIELMKENITSFCYNDSDKIKLFAFSDGSLYRMDDQFVLKELLSPNGERITSIKLLQENQFTASTIKGKITFYKIN